MRHILNTTLIIVGLVVFVNCAQKHHPKPEKLLSKKEMVELMTEMQLLEGELQQNFSALQMDSVKIIIQKDYDILFEKYGISKALFEKNLEYYTFNPTDLTDMYMQVEKNIQKKIDGIKDSLNSTK